MQIQKVTVYHVPPEQLPQDAAEFHRRLASAAFVTIDEPAFTEMGAGFCGFDDYLAYDFARNVTAMEISRPPYIACGLRYDVRRVGARPLDRALRERCAEWLDAKVAAIPAQAPLPGVMAEDRPHGEAPKRVPKDVLKLLKAQVRESLLAQAVPVPNHIPIVVDTSTGHIYVGTTTSRYLEAFELLFLRVFGAMPLALTPHVRLMLAGLEVSESKIAPGQSFLTWLWRRVRDYVDRDEAMELSRPGHREPDSVRIEINQIGLEQMVDVARQRIAAQGHGAGDYDEVLEAVKGGREAVSLGLRILAFDADKFEIHTRSHDLSLTLFKGPKIPKARGDDEDQDRYADFHLHMGHILQAMGYLDDLWAMFVRGAVEAGRVVKVEGVDLDGARVLAAERLAATAKDKGVLVGNAELAVGGKALGVDAGGDHGPDQEPGGMEEAA